MTKAHSELDDNGGRCEKCDRPKTVNMAQSTVPVLLGGGLGWGTMWMCNDCYRAWQDREDLRNARMG